MGFEDRQWKVVIAYDSTVPMKGLHGLHLAFLGLPNVEVMGISDPNKVSTKIDVLMKRSGAKRRFFSVTEMYDACNPDIVVLTSRHPADHYEAIKEAAERGIHIYCEKTLGLNPADVKRIMEVVERNNVKLAVSFPARFSPEFRTIKKFIDQNRLGTIQTLIGRGKCDNRGGGEDMVVLGSHIMDLMLLFVGNPQCVWGDVLRNNEPITADSFEEPTEPLGPVAGDNLNGYYRFSNGVRGIFESRRDISQNWPLTGMGITVVGSKATISARFDDSHSRQVKISLLPYPPDVEAHFEPIRFVELEQIAGAEPYNYNRTVNLPESNLFVEGARQCVVDLMRAICEDRQPESNAYNSYIVSQMVQGVYDSSISGKRIDIN